MYKILSIHYMYNIIDKMYIYNIILHNKNVLYSILLK